MTDLCSIKTKVKFKIRDAGSVLEGMKRHVRGRWMEINVMRRLHEEISVAPELTADFVESAEQKVLR